MQHKEQPKLLYLPWTAAMYYLNPNLVAEKKLFFLYTKKKAEKQTWLWRNDIVVCLPQQLLDVYNTTKL
jgi:hypothetical protein